MKIGIIIGCVGFQLRTILPSGCAGGLTGRLLLVGVDGAGWPRLHRLMDAGKLPHSARLVETGTSGKLECPHLAAPTCLHDPKRRTTTCKGLSAAKTPSEHHMTTLAIPRPEEFGRCRG
jgi:hypothetical protein